eukprot:gene20643-21318_t
MMPVSALVSQGRRTWRMSSAHRAGASRTGDLRSQAVARMQHDLEYCRAGPEIAVYRIMIFAFDDTVLIRNSAYLEVGMKIHLAIAALLLSTVTAQSADFGAKPVVTSPAYVWTGFYAGVGIGGQFNSTATTNDTTVTYYDLFDAPSNPFYQYANYDPRLNSLRAMATVELGYNLRFDRWVAGLGASLDFSSTSKTAEGGFNSIFEGFDAQTRVKTGNTESVYAKLGYLAQDNLLLYGLAGLSTTSVRIDTAVEGGVDLPVASFGQELSKKSQVDGLLLGAGAEYMITSNISLKGEYRYVKYNKVSTSGEYLDNLCECYYYDVASKSSASLTSQSLRAVLGYHF